MASILGAFAVLAVLFAAGALGAYQAGTTSIGIAPRPIGATFEYLIATDFLCRLDPTACPAIARSAGVGDTIELRGAGTFSMFPKTTTGGGTFVHKDAAGNVFAMGTWEAVALLSFQSYGSASAQGLPREFWGGKVMLRVSITPDGATDPLFFGILRVTCVLGDKIPNAATEGVRLVVQGTPFNFNKEVSGLTLFIRT